MDAEGPLLPDRHRLRRSRDFTAVMRGGRRCGRKDLAVHALLPSGGMAAGATAAGCGAEAAVPDPSGARFGLIVSTAVGNAVVRHRVARRLRHAAATYAELIPPSASVVLRAFPSAAEATSEQLDRQVRTGLGKLGLLPSGTRSP